MTATRRCARCHAELEGGSVPDRMLLNPWQRRLLHAYCGPCRRLLSEHVYRVRPSPPPERVWVHVLRGVVTLVLLVVVGVLLRAWFGARW